ncbi:MAG: TetR/AcrR family transcriptional regulator [Planctomycetota bacterium]
MAPAPSNTTRDHILDAAEALLARHGYAAASLRQVTTAAGVNLAAVHYHFGSKEGLLRALFERRLGPINEIRLQRLAAAEEKAAPGPPAVADIVSAMVAPMIESGLGEKAPLHHFTQLVGRMHAEPSNEMARMFKEMLGELLQRFMAALGRALPELPVEELYWRMHFAAGAFSHLMSCHEKVVEMSNGLCNTDDPAAIVERITGFITAGMEAPLNTTPGTLPAAPRASGRQRESRRRKSGST